MGKEKIVEDNVKVFAPTEELPPVTPEPTYICAKCGFIVETGHGHTRRECAAEGEILPDGSELSAGCKTDGFLMSTYDGRPIHPVRPPYYYEEGTFKNWDEHTQKWEREHNLASVERTKPDPFPKKSLLHRIFGDW